MGETERTYLPAAGYHWSLALYDPLVKLLGGDAARAMLLDQAAVSAAHRVLDIGCGTGSLLVLIKRKNPEAEVVGLDPDPRALARARRKGQRSRIRFQLDQGFADELPYPDGSFDRVFSSFMFHHLENSDKVRALREARRVLRPGGRFHLMGLGFTLREIKQLLALSTQRDVGRVKRSAQAKLLDVQARITALERVRDGLTTLIAACPGHGRAADCPILRALTGEEAR